MTILVRLVLSMTAVLSMVVMMTFSPQLTTEIKLSKVQSIWRPVASWLRPPYLYLVINCIIITIFASSKLHDHHHDYSEPIKIFLTDNHYDGEDQRKVVDLPQSSTEIERVDLFLTDNHYDGEDQRKVADLPQSSTEIECVEFSDKVSGNENYSVATTKPMERVNDVQLVDSKNVIVRCSDDGTSKGVNVETWKLPGSDSFIQQKVVQPDTIVRKKLGVPKPKRELQTLESTWKAITDGRPMPITHQNTDGGNLQNAHKMIKSEPFNQQLSRKRNNISRTLAGSSCPGKLKRDPSLGQDELNKRAEAFISRFKEDMRLQRKESLRQYVEMINSGKY